MLLNPIKSVLMKWFIYWTFPKHHLGNDSFWDRKYNYYYFYVTTFSNLYGNKPRQECLFSDFTLCYNLCENVVDIFFDRQDSQLTPLLIHQIVGKNWFNNRTKFCSIKINRSKAMNENVIVKLHLCLSKTRREICNTTFETPYS